MRINTNGLSLAQFRASLPVIQSQPSKGADAGNLALLQPIQSLYGGGQEITKEDALMYRFRRENGVNILTGESQYGRVDNAADVPQEFIGRLNSETVTEWDMQRFRFAVDFNAYGSDLEGNLNSLASVYVTVLDHLQTHFSGEQLGNYVTELETAVSEIRDTMVNYFAESVGGFLDENGLVQEVESTSFFHSLGNEESIGVQTGVLLLKANLFAESDGVTAEFAEKMSEAVKDYIDRKIDKANAEIESSYTLPYYPDDIAERNPVYDKSAIYAVSERMLSVYETKKDYQESILEGIRFAVETSERKEKLQGKADRYQDNLYWDRFFDNTSQFLSRYYVDIQGYDKRTEFQKLADAWNGYVTDISAAGELQLIGNRLYALA